MQHKNYPMYHNCHLFRTECLFLIYCLFYFHYITTEKKWKSSISGKPHIKNSGKEMWNFEKICNFDIILKQNHDAIFFKQNPLIFQGSIGR